MFEFDSDTQKENYISAIKNGVTPNIVIIIGDKVIPSDLISGFTYHDSIGRGGVFTVGTISTASVSFTARISVTAEDILDKDIDVDIHVLTEADENISVPLGHFRADKKNIQISANQAKVTAYDATWTRLDTEYDTELEFPDTVFSVLSDIETNLGLIIEGAIPTLGDDTYPTMYERPTGTYRNVISKCAFLLGCNATINRYGHLGFRYIPTSTPVMAVYQDDTVRNGLEVLSDEFNIATFKNTWTHDETTTYDALTEDGEAQKTSRVDSTYSYSVVFGSATLAAKNNNLRSQNEVDKLGAAILGDKGVHYHAYKLMMLGAPYLSAGDTVTYIPANRDEFDATDFDYSETNTYEDSDDSEDTEEDLIGDIDSAEDTEEDLADDAEIVDYEEEIEAEGDEVELTEFDEADEEAEDDDIYTLFVMDHTLTYNNNDGLVSTVRASIPSGDEDAEIAAGGSGYLAVSDGITNAQDTADEATRLVVDTIAAQQAHFHKLVADEAKIQSLEADSAEIKNLVAEKASISDLTAATGRIDSLETGKADVADLAAATGRISTLESGKADIDFANVTVGNVSEAWIKNLFIQGGFVSQSGTVYNLVGVRIDGDLINANTVKADKLLLQGDDGLYYAINVNALGETTASSDEKYKAGIDGSVIVAHSITADQITANNIVGTGGWINLAEGKFKYGNTSTGNFLSWDGKSLEISLDKLNITSSSGISISVGERLADTLADVTVEYADSISPTTAPTSGWSTTAPAWQEGHYIWSRTTSANVDGTTKTSDPVCITGNAGGQGPPGADGKDAITMAITSSNGFVFKNTAVNTVLTAHVYQAGKELTASTTPTLASVGTIKWYKDGSTTPVGTGQTLTIDADDVTDSASYTAKLEG